MSRRPRYKVAVGDPTGRRSSTWLVWFGPGDIYVAAKSFAGMWKFTVHYPRPPRFPNAIRYFGYTGEYARKTSTGTPVRRTERTRIEPSFLPISPEVWLEALIRIPEEELREWPSDTEGVIWLPHPPTGHMVQLLIVSTPVDYDAQRLVARLKTPASVLDAPLERCGRRAWVLYQEVWTDAGELADVRAKLSKAWPGLTRPGLSGTGTRAVFFGTVSDAIAAMYEVAADSL